MSLFRNKVLKTCLWSLDVKKITGDLRTEGKHSWIIEKQNAEVKTLPAAMSPSVLLSAQGGKWDPSIALSVQNWALLPSERSNRTPSLNPTCPVFSPRAAEEEKGCSELKSKCFHLCLTMPSEVAASWRAVFQQWSLSIWKLQLEHLLCLLGVTAVGMSVA